MNIQIFGTTKCFDTKKALRYFKERKIPVQFVNLKEKGLSKGEYNKVKQAVGGLDAMIDTNCKDKDTLALIQYAVDSEKDAKILENQQVLKTPIVRNGAKATIATRRIFGRPGTDDPAGLTIGNTIPKTQIKPQQRDRRYWGFIVVKI